MYLSRLRKATCNLRFEDMLVLKHVIFFFSPGIPIYWLAKLIQCSTTHEMQSVNENQMLNPFTPKSDIIDFTLSNARRFYLSKGEPLAGFSNLASGRRKSLATLSICAGYFFVFQILLIDNPVSPM